MTKFKFNEKEYSLKQVESAAKQSNLGLDEYLTKTGISRIDGDDDDKKKKKKGVANKGANVTPAENNVPKNTDLKSEGTSSGLQEVGEDLFNTSNSSYVGPSGESDFVKPAVDKQSKALTAFENRTGKKAKSIMDLTDEDYESNIFEDPFSDNSTLVDETKVFVENRSRLKEIAKKRKDLEYKATAYSYKKYGPTPEGVDYIKQRLKTFDDNNAFEIENMEYKPGFKLRSDAVNQLSKDTGNFQASGDAMQDFAQELSVFRLYTGYSAFKDMEATEEIKLKEDVQTAVIDKLDEYQLQKLADGYYNLQEKEDLINEVKMPIVKSRIEDIKRENSLFESGVEQEASDINENQQVILNSIKNLTGGGTQFKKDYNPTEDQVQEYNVLVADFNKGLSDLKGLQKAYEDRKSKMSDNLSSLEGEYGIDLATGALANNFKLSDDIEKYREAYSGDGFWNGVGDIVVGEGVQGLYQLWKKGAVGGTAWAMTVVPDMFESDDTYSRFDAFTDVVNNWSNGTLVPRSEDKKFNITKEEGGFKEFDGRSYLKLGTSMATFTGYLISEVRKGNFKGIKQAVGKTITKFGNKGKVLAPVSQKLKDEIIMVNAAFQATIMDNVKDAERMGLKGISAQAYGMVNSTAESVFQTIMPDNNFLKGVKGKAIKDAFRGSLKNVANKEAAKAASKEYVTNIFKELAEEELTSGVRLITDASFGLALPNSAEFLNSQLELVAGTFMLSGSLGVAGAKNTFGNQKTLIYNQISKNLSSIDKQFAAMYEASNDVEVMEEIKKARQFARDVDKAVRHSPESVNSEQIDLLLKKQKLVEKRESTDSAFFPAIDKKIQEINEKIQESQVKQDIASQFNKDIENIGKSIESTGLKVDETIVFETNENQSSDDQMKEFLLDNVPKSIAEEGEDASEKWANENKDSYGTFVTTKDGREVLIVNKDSALKRSFVTTGQHEFLHKLILSNLGSNNEVISKAGELLLEDLKSLEDGSELKNRILTYAEALGNNEMSKEQFFEEVLPLYSEALTRKDVDINKSTLGKVGDFFRQMFQNAGLKQVSFKDAQGVKNFITDYNKSYNKGKFKGAIKNFSDLSKSKNENQEQESKAAFSKPESVEFIEGKLEELEDKYFDQEIDEYQFEQQREKLEKDLVNAEEAAKIADNKVEVKVGDNIEAEVETETKPIEEVKKVDKIVEEATTEVFEVKEVSDKNKQIAKTNDDIVKEMTDVGANRISEIKDPEARKAIVDKLGENNIGAVTELAKKAAATSRDLPIDKNLKVGYEEFFLGFSEELSALINSYKANVDGKQVPFGAYMNQNLRLRYGSILDRSLKGKLKGSESLSSDKNIKKEVGSFVEDSSSESTSRDEGRVLEQIDVRKFGPAKDKVDQISNIVEVEEGQRPTYKELTEKFVDPVSMELFEVPGRKIQGKATLTDTEAKSLQRLFVSPDNVRKLIKTMPPYNVAGSETTIGERAENIDVSKDIKGRSIGLSNKFIKQFYQPVTRAIPGISSPKGRSLGETSQGQVYELKPEFRGRVSNEAVKQIQNSVGVTEAGVPNEKISAANRTKYGTTLTGFAKTYIANVINVTGRSKQTDKQEQADTGAGKASIMFSKSFDLGLENGSNVDNIASVLFSKSARKKYEQVLKAKRPELKDIPEQVDNLVKWADSLDIRDDKKAKYKNLGLFYMANGYAIFPEDGYKVTESIRLAAINKIDPYSFKNPNELIEKYEKTTKIAKINPDSVSEFSNKEEIAGLTIYDVEDSKKGQEAVRKIVDSNWGKKSNPWCLIARNEDTYLGHEEAYSEKEVKDIIDTNEALGNTVERAGHYMSNGKKVYELVVYAPKNGGELAGAFNLWKSYNEEGNGFKIAFKNGKLNSFRDGNDMQWWDRMDKPQKGPALKIKADPNGLVAEGYIDLKNGAEVIEGYKKDYKEGDLTIEESYTADKKLVGKHTYGKNKFSDKSLISEYSFDQLNDTDYIETESKYEQDNSEVVNITRKFDSQDIHKKTSRKKYYDKNNNIIEQSKERDVKTGVVKDEITFTDNNTGNGTFDVYKAETINGKKNVSIDERKRFISSDNPFKFSKSLSIEKSLIQDFISQKPGKFSARKRNSYARTIKELLEYGGVNGIESFERAVELGDYTKDELDLINFVFEGRDWLFGIFQDDKAQNQGIKLEKLVKVAIKKLGLKDVNLDLSEGGFSSGVDIVLSVKDKKLNIELKLNEKARVGSFTIKRNGDVFSYTKGAEGIETKLPALHEAIQDQLKGDKYQKAWKKYTEEGVKIGKKLLESGKVDIETYVNEETGQLVGPKEVFDYLKDPKKGNYQKDLTIKINQVNGKPIDQKIIELLYNNKDVYDINFGGVGMFALGESISGRPGLDANVEVRIVTSRASSNGVYRSTQRATPFILDINNISDLDLTDLSKVQPNIEKLVESISDESSIKFSKAEKLDRAFNDIIEKKTGIDSRKRYGIVEAITKGSSKGKFNFFIPPAAEDFVGLLYPTLSKGKVGDAQMSWYKKNLIDPFAEGMNRLSKARVYTTNSYNQLKKQLDIVPKNLTKKVGKTDYTKEQAIRVYIWKKQKMEIPGMNSKDVSMLSDYIASNSKLQSFADQLINLQLGDGYAKPKVGWPAGTITTDILEGLNTTKRAKYLSEWQQNVDAIFSEDNLNKLQAAYGVNYRKALEGTLKRMQTGRNRNFSGDSTTGRFTDWLTGSVGAIMFFNTRSAVLQTISAANYINFEDNNIFAAGRAFANQKQYWTDFMKLMNSDFLKERRGGLRMNVNEADISDMAKKGGARGVISKLLEFGFTPTQVADSFAIASGGSTFYRNRIKTYKKQGLSEKEAEKKAFEDFREATEESQQSSRADRISQQQASPLGRVVLAFANAPAQYARIMKKAASDLKNGRGSAKANISRIIYYGAIQNLIFNSLQQALFAMSFDDEEPEDKEKEKKYLSVANGMLDSVLRGTGIAGSLVSVGKNTIIKVIKELDKDRPKLQNIALEVAKISPPVSAKLSRLSSAGKSYDWNKQEMIDKGFSLDNPAYLAAGNVVSALTNVPLDRVVKKANNVVQATTQDLEAWERIALLAGWQDWELGIKKEKEKDQPATKTTYGVPIRRRPTRITIQR